MSMLGNAGGSAYSWQAIISLLYVQLCASVHEYALEMLEGQMMQQDALMAQLAQELDNGRLLRLLSRLIMVSEGNQTSLEPNWSETGQLERKGKREEKSMS